MATINLAERPGLLLVGAIILHVILISAQVNTRTGVPFLRVVTFGAFAEVQRGTMSGVDSVRGLWTGYVDLRAVEAENESLRQENQKLQIRLQEERAVAQTADNLRQLLELRQRAGLETAAAEIIGAGADPDVRTMTIDKGARDGFKPDMAVISPTGIVGRIILSSARASNVQLLIDRNAAAAALIERTRAQGIVVGQGRDTLRMEYVPGTSDVKPGDLVISSGIDGIYPKGFVIGTVDVVDRGPESFHLITVKPAVDFSRIEEVLVVLTLPPLKASEQEPATKPGRAGSPRE